VLSDPIADMLSSVKNGFLVKKDQIKVPYSKIKEQMAKIMVRCGFLTKLEKERIDKVKSRLVLTLKYENGQPVVTNLKRISKPGVRFYTVYKKLPRPVFGSGITIVSTSKGLMTNTEAIKKKLGGELICKIW
jgi:small subunit ribosomal protein S8